MLDRTAEYNAMTPARAATYFVGAILLAAWLASAAGVVRSPTPRPPRRSAESLQLDAVVLDVQSRASRLRQRLAHAPSLQAPLRNPFSFTAAEPVPVATISSRAPVVAPAAPAPAAEPALLLIGVAEDGATRTAMIQSGEELLMATEGQVLAARYRVVKVSADALELLDLVTGATRRLFLKSPALLP